jgi:hypothetical protein
MAKRRRWNETAAEAEVLPTEAPAEVEVLPEAEAEAVADEAPADLPEPSTRVRCLTPIDYFSTTLRFAHGGVGQVVDDLPPELIDGCVAKGLVERIA